MSKEEIKEKAPTIFKKIGGITYRVKVHFSKPGDIIFFQGTYATSGASHVGIYLGDNMMIHCGNPIQYARTDTAYWQQHFYCFCRLPS